MQLYEWAVDTFEGDITEIHEPVATALRGGPIARSGMYPERVYVIAQDELQAYKIATEWLANPVNRLDNVNEEH